MRIALINCSLKPKGRTLLLAKAAMERFRHHGASVRFLDLPKLDLPIAETGEAEDDEASALVASTIARADAVVLAAPVHHFGVGAGVANLLHLAGSAWSNQIVGLMGMGASRSHQMGLLQAAGSLLMEFHCMIVPRVVFAPAAEFAHGDRPSAEVGEQIDAMCVETIRIVQAFVEPEPVAPTASGVRRGGQPAPEPPPMTITDNTVVDGQMIGPDGKPLPSRGKGKRTKVRVRQVLWNERS